MGEINTRRNPSHLDGVTRAPLRILGMSLVEVGTGDGKLIRKWIRVVPDQYLSKDGDILFGCDILKVHALYEMKYFILGNDVICSKLCLTQM